MRKVRKDAAAVAMAKKRWKGKTKAERLATSRHAAEARSRKAAERRVAREYQLIDERHPDNGPTEEEGTA